MPEILLLQSVQGGGPVYGDPGDKLTVDDDTADVWADGTRAVLVNPQPAPVSLVKPPRGSAGDWPADSWAGAFAAAAKQEPLNGQSAPPPVKPTKPPRRGR